MTNYARNQPRDVGGESMQGYPAPYPAISRIVSENATVSSVISLNPNTTVIEVAVKGGSAAIRWIPATETAAVSPFASIVTSAADNNFDHILTLDTVRRFVVPKETRGAATGQAGSVNGLYQRVAYRTLNLGSVLLTEY